MFLLPVLFILFTSHQVSTYQVQGGNRETVQVTAPATVEQPATVTIQGDQEDSDNLQPAMGYETLSQGSQGIRLQ